MHVPVEAGKLRCAPFKCGRSIPDAVKTLTAKTVLGVRTLTTILIIHCGKVLVTWPCVQIFTAVGLRVFDSSSPALLTVTTGWQQLGLELRRENLRYAGLGSRERLLIRTLVTYCITGKNCSTIYRGARGNYIAIPTFIIHWQACRTTE